ncbi:MAG: hypothetical protein JZU52_12665 [Lamprocystis purpurea]|nr:hypothetical protein [Lamprocystis purpurea]
MEALRAQLAAEFAAGLKAATGHESLSALKAAQDQAAADKLAEQGQFKQLAEQAQAQLGEVKAAYHAERIRGAVLAAATDAIDPETVRALLAGEAQVGSDGTVTIGGQTPAAAVAALLAAKPFLARPAGSAGSGSAGGGRAGRRCGRTIRPRSSSARPRPSTRHSRGKPWRSVSQVIFRSTTHSSGAGSPRSWRSPRPR